MIIGIMQPYFFPYLGYFQIIAAVNRYVIYDDVNFIKNGWINRNNILLNGKKHLITLPLEGATPYEKINETKITSNLKQKEKLLKTIKVAYQKAPYFDKIYPIVEKTVMFENLNISEAIAYSINEIVNYLELKTEILISSQISKNNELKGEDKVINIVKTLGGKKYYNAIGGIKLYNIENFQKNSIELKFIQTNEIKYNQFNNNFVPDLSIIDILMFNSKENIKNLLEKYTLITSCPAEIKKNNLI